MQQLPLGISPPRRAGLRQLRRRAERRGARARARARAGAAARERIVYLWGEPGSGRSTCCAPPRAPIRRWSSPTTSSTLDAAGQQALFVAINAARDGGPAVLAAGSAPPARLGLREDLRTRLAWGLVYQLVPLGDADKAAHLRAEAARAGLRLSDEVVAYLLTPPAARPREPPCGPGILDRHSLMRQRRAHPAAGSRGLSKATVKSQVAQPPGGSLSRFASACSRAAQRSLRCLPHARRRPCHRAGRVRAAFAPIGPARCPSAASPGSIRASRAAGSRPNTTASASPPTTGAMPTASRRRRACTGRTRSASAQPRHVARQNSRDSDLDPRPLSVFGRYWFAQDWAVSAEIAVARPDGALPPAGLPHRRAAPLLSALASAQLNSGRACAWPCSTSTTRCSPATATTSGASSWSTAACSSARPTRRRTAPTTSSTSPARSTSTNTSASRCARSPRTRRRTSTRWHARIHARCASLPMISAAARALVRRHLDARRPVRHHHRHQQLRHRADRARVRRRRTSSPPSPRRATAASPAASPARPASAKARCARLDEWLGGLGRRLDDFEESAFYSDSHNDLPLLERVIAPGGGRPRRRRWRAEAARRGWAMHFAAPVESPARE